MNKLNIEKQQTTITGLVEGCSIRSVERMTGIHRDTIMRLLLKVGSGCERLLDKQMRNLSCEQIQVDEIWGFIGKKQRHITENDNPLEVGDCWTFVAIDSDTKLIPAYRVGKRTASEATAFLDDLVSRLTNRAQLSSDSLRAYVEACEHAFGPHVDYGQIVKSYEADPINPGRYSPPHVIGTSRRRITGNPRYERISTSHVERHNLSLRTSCRRLTRLTSGFSKKLENFKAAMALYFAHYNLCRVHQSLRVTPAMEAGVTSRVWSLRGLLMEVSA
jgi:IS1 family transposase